MFTIEYDLLGSLFEPFPLIYLFIYLIKYIISVFGAVRLFRITRFLEVL
jgi:hypothetical protein